MRFALIALLPLAGCFVAPSSHVTTRHVGFEPSSEVRKGLARGLTLKTTVVHGQAVISAIRTRDCHREVFEVVEVTERRGLRMAVPEDPRAGVFGFFLAPVTMPVSLLFSTISVAANHENQHQVRKAHHDEMTACTEPAGNVAIEIELASGVKLIEHTDDNGSLALTIPKAEPAQGVITARAETQVAQLKYRRKSALAMRPESLGE